MDRGSMGRWRRSKMIAALDRLAKMDEAIELMQDLRRETVELFAELFPGDCQKDLFAFEGRSLSHAALPRSPHGLPGISFGLTICPSIGLPPYPDMIIQSGERSFKIRGRYNISPIIPRPSSCAGWHQRPLPGGIRSVGLSRLGSSLQPSTCP